MTPKFFIEAILLGCGLAMDACAVSMTNGLKEPKMKYPKVITIALVFGFMQGMMPLIGYFIGHLFFKYIEKFIPFIALAILGYLGTKMIWDGTHPCKDGEECKINQNITIKAILIQGIATSIDALSVGFSFPGYTQTQAIVAVSIIALATFAICFAGVLIGKRFGDKLGNKAVIIGGSILILIGIEICITSFI